MRMPLTAQQPWTGTMDRARDAEQETDTPSATSDCHGRRHRITDVSGFGAPTMRDRTIGIQRPVLTATARKVGRDSGCAVRRPTLPGPRARAAARRGGVARVGVQRGSGVDPRLAWSRPSEETRTAAQRPVRYRTEYLAPRSLHPSARVQPALPASTPTSGARRVSRTIRSSNHNLVMRDREDVAPPPDRRDSDAAG